MKALAAGVVLLLSSACGSRGPACDVTDHEPLAPPASAPVWDTLKQAEVELHEQNKSLPAAMRLMDCRDHWQTVGEERVCHEATLQLCARRCKTDAERKTCGENQEHARLMQQCRVQLVTVFAGIYSSCSGFHLCGEILQPSTTACPS
jgi:hypothetical protein